jgi:hypothetical protein
MPQQSLHVRYWGMGQIGQTPETAKVRQNANITGEGGSTFAPCRLSGTAPILRHAEVWYEFGFQGESGSRSDTAKLSRMTLTGHATSRRALE